jgi:hypothetical protein
MAYNKKIKRVANISVEEFCSSYLSRNEPVIIESSIDWVDSEIWFFDKLSKEFGSTVIQVYNETFELKTLSTLEDYINTHILRKNINQNGKDISYARLYSKMRNMDFAWSDELFDKIKSFWQVPKFIPEYGYLLPNSKEKLSPLVNRFPGRVIFISPAGARTSNHIDPWCSDAILCQVQGVKEIILYRPNQKELLTNGDLIVDIDSPDTLKFPDYEKAEIAYEDEIKKGEVIYIPNSWFHHVRTLENSISISWNFIHETSLLNNLTSTTANCFKNEIDKDVLDFFTTGNFLNNKLNS